VEIEYWSRRMLTLISITEQLKTKPSRVVTGVLKARALRAEPEDSQHDENAVSEQEKIKNLIERWREVDLAITDSLNESKDNVRFLENLRKVIEPLYTESPKVIADAMPSLMNSMKMIHTLSRHYGTEVRMTNLFERITNQIIVRCKSEVYSKENVAHLWKQNPQEVMEKMNSCIALCETYNQYYSDTKVKLAEMPKGKQFNFDENSIFGKLTRFRRRLEKLIDMFSSIEQFKALREKRIDSMEPLLDSFDELVNEFKVKGHDLLDFYNTVFERDYVEFAMRNSLLENAIQNFMERSLSQMSSIDKQLELLQKFKDVLHREPLKDDLHTKYIMVFKIYGEELHEVQHQYEKHKQNPPIPRNMTRIAGNIHWARQLLRFITGPMRHFMKNPKVFHSKDSKKIVTHYNKLAKILIQFEHLYYIAFQKSTDQAKKGLRKRILVQDPNTKELKVNFDAGVIQLIREAKHMQLMDLQIPDSGKIVLLMEDKLKAYYHDFTHALSRHQAIVKKTNPVCLSLLKPHFQDLEETIKPALVTPLQRLCDACVTPL
jgi:dynein heavy chain